MTSVAVIALLAGLAGHSGHDLTARLKGPSQLESGKPFTLTVEITNISSKSYLYRQHWKWASNTMSIEAKGPDGVVIRTEPLLFDIDARADCFYTKPLDSHDRFTFEVQINRSGMATLQLRFPRPGRYELAWVYEFAVEPVDNRHKCFDVPYWQGKLRSNAVTVEVAK